MKIPQPPRFRGPSIRNFTRFCYRALAGAGLLVVVLFAAGVLWLRYVTLPNVDPVQEMVNMISASRSYQANVETLNTAKQLMLKTLTIGT